MVESILTPFFWAALGLFVHALFWTFISWCKKRADFADIAWGLGFILVSWISFFIGIRSQIGLVITALTTLWGLRLATHVYLRNRKKEEDTRYKALRGSKKLFPFLFFKVYLLQSCLLYLIATPIIWGNTFKIPYSSLLFWSAIYFWIFGFVFEVIADFQLFRFKQDPKNKGKLFIQGMWKLSQHPNYLGEIVLWWAIWLLVLPSPNGWTMIFSPLTITLLILYVSGIPLLEKKMKQHPEFHSYNENTPRLFPPAILNGIFYSAFWVISVYYAGAQFYSLSIIAAFCFFALQGSIFLYTDRKIFALSLPLAIVALALGWLQEKLFLYLGIISFLPETPYPPLWIVLFYPVFSMTLNSAFRFLNQNLLLTFFIGAVGGVLSFYTGILQGALILNSWAFFPICFFSWGAYLTLLIIYNRSLLKIYFRLHSQETLNSPLTVIFDGSCKICEKEMCSLKKRRQTGVVIYANPKNENELKQLTDQFSFAQSMQSIYSFDSKGNIYQGIDTLARVYAKTNLEYLALLISAPGFHFFFKILYRIWARFRPRNNF